MVLSGQREVTDTSMDVLFVKLLGNNFQECLNHSLSLNGDKWEDTTMKLLLFCDHRAYSSHTGVFIFSVRGIQCDLLCQTALHKPENQNPYALLRAQGFFSG